MLTSLQEKKMNLDGLGDGCLKCCMFMNAITLNSHLIYKQSLIMLPYSKHFTQGKLTHLHTFICLRFCCHLQAYFFLSRIFNMP